MKTSEKNLDDIIFENRNKDYGAYVLRRNYNKNMVSAIIIAIVIFLFFVSVPILANYFNKGKTVTTNFDPTVIFTTDPTEKPVEKLPEAPAEKKKLPVYDFFIFSFQLTGASFMLAVMVLASAWMMPFSRRVAAGDDYLLYGVLAVSGFYAKPAKAFSEVVVSGSKINDEELTRWSRSILGGNKNDAGQVAGASEGFGQ